MDLPEMIFLIAVTVILPISVLSLLFSYQKARLKSKQTRSDNELTTSELQNMIDAAVFDATAQLQERVEVLEDRLRLLGPAEEPSESMERPSTKTMGGMTKE